VPERLGAGNATISEVAEPFGMPLTGMKKLIQRLEEPNLAAIKNVGRARRCVFTRTPSRALVRGCGGSTASRRLSNAREETDEQHHRHHTE
jgi:hypothetical protein